MAFSALVAQPPARGAAPPQGTAVTSFAPDLSFLVLSAPGKYSRLKATGFFSHTTVETVTELYLSESQ